VALYADRVKESTTATGTGAITLSGSAPTGYQTFAAAFGTGTQTVAYCIADQTGPNWEVGTGTYNGSANTLARTTVLASSNGGSLTNFSGGTQDVFCTAPAKYLDTFTSTNQGVVPASGGGTANFLRADGSFAAPPATAPAGSTTQIQFNNASAFGASANFTYATGTNTFTVGPAGATTIIETLAPTGSTVAGTLTVRGKNASATNGAGGGLQFTAGNALGTGTGGALSFASGSSPSGTGGGISFTSNSGATGGNLTFNTGGSTTGSAGSAIFNIAAGGGATSNGGGFQVIAGNAGNNGNGGSVVINSGSSGGSGLGGDFDFRCGYGAGGSGSMFFNTDNFTIIQLTEDSTPVAQLGFFGVTPVIQPTTATTAATRVAVIGTVANIGDTYDGYTLAKVVRALRDLGILA
jgi:hypothetical protein